MNLGKNMAKELGPLLLPIFSSHILLLYVIQAQYISSVEPNSMTPWSTPIQNMVWSPY